MRFKAVALVVALATFGLISTVAAPSVADADTCQPPTACPHSVPMMSSPNPSVQGQFVQFRIDFGQWCAYGGHGFDFVAMAANNQTIDLGVRALPAAGHVLYAAWSTLPAGTYRASASTYLCNETPYTVVSLFTNEVLQTVKPQAASAPRQPVPPQVKPPATPPNVVVPAINIQAGKLLPRLADFHTVAALQQPPTPAVPVGSGLAILVAGALGVVAVGGLRRRSRR